MSQKRLKIFTTEHKKEANELKLGYLNNSMFIFFRQHIGLNA